MKRAREEDTSEGLQGPATSRPASTPSTSPAKRRREEDTHANKLQRSSKAVRPDSSESTPYNQSASTVAQHYNARPEVGRERRQESPILRLKNFNNWVKSILIGRHARRGFRVLDLCCGKGGDLLKWSKAQVGDLIGVDIADVSVEQARQRFREGRHRFNARFFAKDCFASGGHFVGTVPNAYWLVKQLQNIKGDGLTFGNSILTITFDQKKDYPMFGHKYFFELKDAIDNCPEYLLYFPKLVELANEYGLELVTKKVFHEFYQEAVKEEANRQLLYRMNVVNAEGTMSADEWEVAEQ
ncbi:mRNA cap guanine-N7 methyltransferase [Rhizophlyctis rosea]|nr:mRNA cap guanine-N7 methyltransferase [Rhizophlyctis rosea]